jgi:hypothetical protein
MNRRTKAQTFLASMLAVLAAIAVAGVDLPTSAQNTNSSTTDTAAQVSPGIGGGVDEDLSGTYTGNVRTAGAHEMASTPATLTITGINFTLSTTDGAMTHTGIFRAVNTRGWIGAALRLSDMTDPVSNTPLTYSVRARRNGDRLTLTPSPGDRNKLWFTPSGGGGGGRRRRRRATTPVEQPVPDATPTPPPALSN